MSLSGLMDKENVMYTQYIYMHTQWDIHSTYTYIQYVCMYTHSIYTCTHNGIFFRFSKEGNPAICKSVEELGGCYAK